MLRSGKFCISVESVCAAADWFSGVGGVTTSTVDTACECAHSHDSARLGNSVWTCVAVRLIDGSGRPGRSTGGATFLRSTTTRTSHGRKCPDGSARAGVNSHGKSGGRSRDGQGLGSGWSWRAGSCARSGAVDADRRRAVQRQVDVAGHRGRRVPVPFGLQRQPHGDARTRRQRTAGGIGVGVPLPRRDQGMKR